jgi:membrane associated rhomboid family serine protease
LSILEKIKESRLVTRFIIVLCSVIYLGELTNPNLLSQMQLDPKHPTLGQLITSMFAHVNIVHLVINMWALWIIGKLLEKEFGPTKFLLIYMLGGIFGGFAFLLFNNGIPAVGASGAIFALLGILLPFTRYSKSLLQVIALNVVVGFLLPNIAWQAHIGGLIGGFLMGIYLYEPNPVKTFLDGKLSKLRKKKN